MMFRGSISSLATSSTANLVRWVGVYVALALQARHEGRSDAALPAPLQLHGDLLIGRVGWARNRRQVAWKERAWGSQPPF